MFPFDVCLGPILNMNAKSSNTKGCGNASTENLGKKKTNTCVCLTSSAGLGLAVEYTYKLFAVF